MLHNNKSFTERNDKQIDLRDNEGYDRIKLHILINKLQFYPILFAICFIPQVIYMIYGFIFHTRMFLEFSIVCIACINMNGIIISSNYFIQQTFYYNIYTKKYEYYLFDFMKSNNSTYHHVMYRNKNNINMLNPFIFIGRNVTSVVNYIQSSNHSTAFTQSKDLGKSYHSSTDENSKTNMPLLIPQHRDIHGNNRDASYDYENMVNTIQENYEYSPSGSSRYDLINEDDLSE
jgi:hypothetical protein